MSNDYLPRAQVAWLSPPCTEYSNLGRLSMGVTDGLGIHFARMVYGLGAQVVMIEQVPNYSRSRSYYHLKQTLTALGFSYWKETTIDVFKLGSLESRKRGYAIGMKQYLDFSWPSIPYIPHHKRKTNDQVLDKKWDIGEWKHIEGTVMNHWLNRTSETHNFTSENSRVLVDISDKRVSTFTCSYPKITISNSYLKHLKENKWRRFLPEEIQKNMDIPSWFSFPNWL